MELIDSQINLIDGIGMQVEISCELSSDDKLLYITGGHQISVFRRDLATGLLNLIQEIKGNNQYNAGLAYSRESKSSLNSKFLYAITNYHGSGAVVVLSKDPVFDTLSIEQTYIFPTIFPYDALINPNSITISPNNKILCVNSDYKMAFFEIDSLSGKINLLNTFNSTSSYNFSAGGRKTYDLNGGFIYSCPGYSDTIFIYKSNLFIKDSISICPGDTVTLSSFRNYINYYWSTGSQNPSIRVYNEGAYVLQVADKYGKNFQDTVHLCINSLPVVNLGKDTILEKNQSIMISPGIDFFETYIWDIHILSNSVNIDSIYYYSGYYILNDASFQEETLFNISLVVVDGHGCTNSDSIKVRLMAPLETNLNIPKLSKTIKVYPNPANETVHIEQSSNNNDEKAMINVYSGNGQLYYTNLFQNRISIDISSFPKGTYIIWILNKHQWEIQKFIKK